MKKRVFIVVAVMLMLVLAGCEGSSFGLVVNDDNTMVITAENSGDGDAASGVLTVGENESLKTEPDLSDEGTIRLDIYEGELPMDADLTEDDLGDPIASVMLAGQDAGGIDLEAGDYTIVANVEGKVSGTANVSVVPRS